MGDDMTTAPTATTDRSSWVLYAATMFVIVGIMNVLYGLTMIINDTWIVFGATEVWYIDLTAWGWITLLLGILGLLVAYGISLGQTWAKVVGTTVAALTAIDAFLIIPYYPIWGVVILALAMLVIWALTVHGDEVF